MKPNFTVLIAAATLAVSPVAVTGAERDIPASVAGLAGGIDRVLTGGYWEVDEESGFYRVVITSGGIEHISQRLFLQWLRNDYSTQGYELVRTVEFPQDPGRIGVVFDVELDYPDDGSFEAIIDIYQRDQSFQRYVVTLAEDATYSVTQ